MISAVLKSKAVPARNHGVPNLRAWQFFGSQRRTPRISYQKNQRLVQSMLNFCRQVAVIFFERIGKQQIHGTKQLLLFLKSRNKFFMIRKRTAKFTCANC